MIYVLRSICYPTGHMIILLSQSSYDIFAIPLVIRYICYPARLMIYFGVIAIPIVIWYICYPTRHMIYLLSHSSYDIFAIPIVLWYICYPNRHMIYLLSQSSYDIFAIPIVLWYICYPNRHMIYLLSHSSYDIFLLSRSSSHMWLIVAIMHLVHGGARWVTRPMLPHVVQITNRPRSTVDHLCPNLPLDVVQELYSRDPTHETCPRSCRFCGSHRATWATSYRSYRSYRSETYLHWNI